MPIEIKELHIKINVNEGAKAPTEKVEKKKVEDVVSECVAQVMRVIEQKKER